MAHLVKYTGPFSPAEIEFSGKRILVVSNQVIELTNTQIEGLLKAQPGWWYTSEELEPEAAPVAEEETMTISAPFSLSWGAHFVFCNATAGGFAVGLPSPATYKNKEYVIANTAANTNAVTLETVSGLIVAPNVTAATKLVISKTAVYASVSVSADGTNWRVI